MSKILINESALTKALSAPEAREEARRLQGSLQRVIDTDTV